MPLWSRIRAWVPVAGCCLAACAAPYGKVQTFTHPAGQPAVSGRMDAPSDAVEALLRQMTLEEKVGQMTQLTMSMFAPKALGAHHPHKRTIDPNKLREAIETYHVGSLFNVVDTVGSSDETAAAWRHLMAQLKELTERHGRLKIPIIFGIDAVHGASYTTDATLFAHPIAQAASFDRTLVAAIARTAAKDVAASGIAWNFSPDLDVARHPLWSRMYETFGESPWVVRELGRHAVAAHQASLACAKHYLGYGATRTGHDRDPGLVGERMMRELYLPPFAAAVAAGVPSIMVNSGTIDGVPLPASAQWLTHTLRDELHFDGVVVTDWEDISRLYTRDHVADSPKEAVRLGIMAGIDMSMVPEDYAFTRLLIELVREGRVPMARIDTSVRRILRLKQRAHLLEPEKTLEAQTPVVGEQADRALASQAARAAVTLLKNEHNLLPLRPTMRVLVTGPQADSLPALAGGWTHTWQGSMHAAYQHEGKTIIEALRELGAGRVHFARTQAEAVAQAKHHDVAVVCIGEQPYTEWLGDIDDLTLDRDQLELAAAMEATGTPTVLVLVEGRPRIIRPIVDGARAIVMAYLPGYEGGTAIAQTLYGQHNPSGRLPMTYPRATGALRLSDAGWAERHFDRPLAVEWPLGFGLSYSRFVVSNLAVPKRVALGQNVPVTLTVTNHGPKAGSYTVLLRLRDRYASIAPPIEQVRGFATVQLEPQQTTQVTMQLTPFELSFIGDDMQRIIEPGDFDVLIDDAKASFAVEPGATGTPLRL